MNKRIAAIAKAMQGHKNNISENLLGKVSIPCEDYVKHEVGRPYTSTDGKSYKVGQFPHTDARKLVKHWVDCVDFAKSKGMKIDDDVMESYNRAKKTVNNPRDYHDILVAAYADYLHNDVERKKINYGRK